MKYFAYGSNMLEERLKARVPGGIFINTCSVRKYKLRFHKKSDDCSGKCNIVKTGFKKDAIYGVVFEVPDDQLKALNEAEGIGHGYRHNYNISIRLADGTKPPVLTYVATGLKYIDDSLIPYVWYHALVIAGAEQHKLPEDYIAGLQAVPYSYGPQAKQTHETRSRGSAERIL